MPLQNCFLWIHLFIATVKKPPHHQTDIEGLEHKADEEQLTELGDTQPGEKEAQEGIFTLSNSLMGGCSQVGGWFLFSSKK